MNKIKNIFLDLEFDGTNYSGWQKQNNAISVCDVVTKALDQLICEQIDLIGCGRTDAGVHALNYACNFRTTSNIPPSSFCLALNANLPKDIVCKYSAEVDIDFHSRYSAISKRYIYLIHNTMIRSALNRNFHYHFQKPLDITLMQQAIPHFIGEHDFRAFMASGSKVKDTVRTIFEMNINKDEDIIEIDIKGDGFLYNMVRIIVGTLIDVGLKKTKPDNVGNIILSQDRKNAGKTSPACGLYMAEIFY